MQMCIPSPFKRGAQMRPFSRLRCIRQSEIQALIYDEYEDIEVWLSEDEMDAWIEKEEIDYNKYKEDCRISQEEETYTEESDRIDHEITLQRRRVDKIKFDIKCKIRTDLEDRKKRKRDQEINEQQIVHAHSMDIKYKNDEVYNIKLKMDENYQILEKMHKAKMERRRIKH